MGYLIVVLIIIISHSISNNENALIQKIISHGYIGNIISYFPSYLIGAFYGHLVNTDNVQDNLKYALGVIVVSLIGDGIYSGFFLKIVIRMIPIFLLHLMPIYVEIPKKICKVSFLMYALHQPFLGDTVKYIRNFWNEITELAIVSNIGTRVVELVLIVCLAEVIYHISDKYTPKVLAIMTGGRK